MDNRIKCFVLVFSTALNLITCQNTCQNADIGFVLDTSESVQNSLQTTRDFLKQFVNNVIIGLNEVQVGLVNYGPNAIVEFYLNTHNNRNSVNQAINGINAISGKTDTTTALERLRDDLFNSVNGDRKDSPNIGILITDGIANLRENELSTVAASLKNSGTTMIAIGVTQSVDIQQLETIASSKDDVIIVDEFSTLLSNLTTILQRACAVRSTPAPWLCDVKADIALVLDESTSITWFQPTDWKNKVLRFAADIVSSFKLGPQDTQFGVTLFSSSARIVVELDTYSDRNQLVKFIAGLTHNGGETNLADALRQTRNTIFTANKGDRPDAPNFIVLFTDGQANVEAADLPRQANLTKAAGIEIFVIGIGQGVDMTELRKIASTPFSTHVFMGDNLDALSMLQQEVLQQVCRTTTTSTTSTTTTTTTTPTPTTTTTTTTTTTPTPTTTTTTTTPTPTTTTTVSAPDTPPPSTPTPSTTTTTTTSTTTTPTTTTTTRAPPGPCIGEANLVFILDVSGSIEQNNFNKIINFAESIVDRVDVESGKIRVGTITFSDTVKTEFFLNAYSTRGGVISGLQSIIYRRGTTNTADALQYLRLNMYTTANGGRQGVRNVAVVITDGESNNRVRTLEEARLTKTSGIHVISLGIGNWLDENELYAIASYPSTTNMKRVESFDALPTVVELLKDAICDNNNDCNVNGGNPCLNGGACHDEIGYYWCQCQPGFGGTNCSEPCKTSADVVFALDASGSIGKQNFRKLVEFVTEVVTTLDVDHANTMGTRVGAITFATDVQPEFQLKDYNTKMEILNALDLYYTGGKTNTAAALSYICNTMFTSGNGDRSNVKNYIVLFTDGRSNNATLTWDAAMNCRARGVFILAVGIGAGISLNELGSIVSEPADKNILIAKNFDSLTSDIISTIQSSVCDNTKECTPNPCFNGRCVEGMNGFQCICTSPYSGTLCNRACGDQVDVIFALDSSGSIRNERWPIILNFVANITKEFEFYQLDKTRVGLAYWSDVAHIGFHLNEYSRKQDVIEAVKRTRFLAGRTNTQDVLKRVRTEMFVESRGDRLGTLARNFLIIVTDGNSNVDEINTLPEAAQLRVAGVTIVVIPLGEQFANMREINAMASEPVDQMVLKVDRFSKLPGIVGGIVNATCNEVNECASNPCQNGGTCIDEIKRYVCECRSGFTGIDCSRVCSMSNTDLVLALDISGSTQEQFNMTVSFALELVYGLDMAQDRTRVGLVTFSNDAQIKFYLNTYTSKRELVNAMRFAYSGGRTNIQDALLRVNSEVFLNSRGDRFAATNIVVLVSDGYPTTNVGREIAEATNVKNRGAFIFTIALGNNPDLSLLNGISSNPDSNFVFRLRNPSETARAVTDTLGEICR